MSRSRKKHPFVGITTAESDAPFKRAENRAKRRSVRSLVKTGLEDYLPSERLYGDPWASPKDGKSRWDNPRGYRK